MDLKTWLRRHDVDGSPMGRLISHAAWCRDPEELLIGISKGTEAEFPVSFKALAQGLVEAFKREGGKFRSPDRFARVKPGKFIGGDVIQYRPKPVQQAASSYDQSWTAFYATLLGIEVDADVVDIETKRDPAGATITVLAPVRNRRRRLIA